MRLSDKCQLLQNFNTRPLLTLMKSSFYSSHNQRSYFSHNSQSEKNGYFLTFRDVRKPSSNLRLIKTELIRVRYNPNDNCFIMRPPKRRCLGFACSLTCMCTKTGVRMHVDTYM